MESSDIYDHSTLRGKVCKFWKSITWKKGLAWLGLVILIALAGTVIGVQVEQGKDFASINDFTLHNGTFKFTGGNETFFPIFPGFDVSADPTQVTSIILEYVTINAPSFSRSLLNFTKVVSLKLEEVFITETFHQVNLPKLKEFKLNQLIQVTDELFTYQNSSTLKSYLFFKTVPGIKWNVTNICDLGVDISYTVNGTKLVNVLRNGDEPGAIELDVPFCNDILSNTTGAYASLSLANCTVLDSVIPSDLRYLNLHNVTFAKESNIGILLKKMEKLEHFFAFLPEITIDLKDIPKTLTHLSLNNIKLILSLTVDSVIPKLTDLTIAYSAISPKFYTGFLTHFPSLECIAAFGSQTANYQLLNISLNKNISIIMENFNRRPETELERKIDTQLVNFGLSREDSDFVISALTSRGGRHGTSLTVVESLEYKFKLLGYDQFLSFSEFFKTQAQYKSII